MLRLTEVKLPLDHPENAIEAAILQRLGIVAHELVGYSIARRGYDARKPRAIVFVYTLEIEVKDEHRPQVDELMTDKEYSSYIEENA